MYDILTMCPFDFVYRLLLVLMTSVPMLHGPPAAMQNSAKAHAADESKFLSTRLPHATISPNYLYTNSTSHKWAFGAIAELIDNAQDPDVLADQISIELREMRGHKALVLSDNGRGLPAAGLLKMLGFGHSDKTQYDSAVGRSPC